ncbi:alpha amylase N-terminal ig-like domain-containing protein [Thermococcus sp. AM4]|uniref:alpha amylase N-terminal ig-like domain-containing protein n=1 Tax=Thermococcus sp. (strain AM4) TaxID=246969 RepID=UPI000186FB43|nr:alpha amylase N-terminal ig-like domain-containing protein [Thermococcus sp. AM4]EEB74530.1 Neopullulanase/cyclomaltodextrinase [Thermococcus sp. AM4]
MYKTFGFVEDPVFGRLAKVEFSIPYRGEEYAYLLGSFNAFNEGSFRMEKRGNRWAVTVLLPEGVWRYAFSLGGRFEVDPENESTETYRRPSYKFEKTVSVARIAGPELAYHSPSLLHLYSFGGRVHFILRARKDRLHSVFLVMDDARIEMRKRASDELFDYFGVDVGGIEGTIEYSFVGEGREGTFELGPFEAVPMTLEAPEWPLGRVFYQVMPDRFAGRSLGDSGDFCGGDLWGLIERLDHITGLGFNALYLTPIFESTTYHGYDIVDYFHVSRRLGGDEAFEALVGELRKRNVRLILDGVFHHTSFFHPYFQDVVEKGEKSRYAGFYRVLGFPVVSERFLEVLNSDLPPGELGKALRKVGWNYESFYSVWLMPRLNHDNEEVFEFVVGVMRHWLGGADGWRLDVAHGVPPDFWARVRERVPSSAYLIGEVMDDGRLYLFRGFHGVMNYALYDAMLRFFAFGETTAEEFLNELELISVRYGPAEYYAYNFLDNHDTERFLDLVGDERIYLCALAFLMTYKGIPAVFYGDEIGLRGRKGGGLDVGRTPMDWESENWNHKILKTTEKLVRLRRNSRALQVGTFRPLFFRSRTMVYERAAGDEVLIVAINCSDAPAEVPLPDGRGITIPPLAFRIIDAGR